MNYEPKSPSPVREMAKESNPTSQEGYPLAFHSIDPKLGRGNGKEKIEYGAQAELLSKSP